MAKSEAELIEVFKKHVIEKTKDPAFLHHPWFVEHHLITAERIALELLEFYPQANRDLAQVLVWLHDYGKILDRQREHELTAPKGQQILTQIGFAPDFVAQVVDYAITLDRHSEIDLTTAPIEVQIVSSADECSHFIGPFFALWFWENSDRPFQELMAGNYRKATQDWTHKITLPEAKESFAERYRFVCEQSGVLPERFIQTRRSNSSD